MTDIRGKALSDLHFGEVDSESEQDLTARFLATQEFESFAGGQRVDLVLGPKGSGKSAMFQLFAHHQEHARQLVGSALDDTIIATGTGFRDVSELSTSEIEILRREPDFDFERLWTLYIAIKAAVAIGEAGLESKGHLREFLRQKQLAKDFRVLPVLQSFWRNVVSGRPPASFKVTVQGATVEIGTEQDSFDIFDLLDEIDTLLGSTDRELWLLFDNLDELYASDPKTRTAALSALFASVNQLRGRFGQIRPKIFLRTDLWASLSFNNKSHWIGKDLQLSWREDELVTLLLKRALLNPLVAAYLSAIVPKVMDSAGLAEVSQAEQRALWYGLVEKRVDGDGPDESFRWMCSRSTDSRYGALPREVITFANLAARAQRSAGRGPDTSLIGARALRDAYPELSRIRCETFLSEFPELQQHFKRFRGKTSAHFHREELVRLMRGLRPSGEHMVEGLYEVGVIAPIDGDVSVANTFEVPVLYRAGLGLLR